MIIGCISRFPGSEAVAWHHYGTAAIYRVISASFLDITGLIGERAPQAMLILMSSIHALCGGVFCVIAHRIAIIGGRDAFTKAAIFFGIVFSGVILVFTHHEFYAPSLVFALWGIYLSLKDSQKWLFLIPTFTAIILNPILAFLLILIFPDKSEKARFFTLVGFLILILMYFIANIFVKLPFSHHFLPVSDWRYFFSFAHLSNFINFTIFSSPVVFAFIYNKRGARPDKLVYLALCSLIIVFLIEFDFGAMDWDLAATILLPVTILSAFQLSKIPRKAVLVILSFAVLLTISWLVLNFDLERGLSKGETTILAQRTAYFRRKPPEERLIQIYYRNIYRSARLDRIDKWCNVCIEECPYRTMPYIYMILNSLERGNTSLGAYYAIKAFERTNLERSILPNILHHLTISDESFLKQSMAEMKIGDEIREMVVSFPVNERLEREVLRLAEEGQELDTLWNKTLVEVLHISGYIPYLASSGKMEVVEKFYRGGRRLYPNSPAIANNWGIVLNYLRRTKEAREVFDIAFSLGGDEGNYYNNIASSYYNEQNYLEAERHILKAIEIEPGRAIFNINYTAILFRLGRRTEGITHLKGYIKRADYESAEVTLKFMHEIGIE